MWFQTKNQHLLKEMQKRIWCMQCEINALHNQVYNLLHPEYQHQHRALVQQGYRHCTRCGAELF